MTKIYIDFSNSDMTTDLQTALSNLTNANNVGCDIPGDFGYANSLRNCLNDISSAKNNVNTLISWYANSKNELQNAENALVNSCPKDIFKVTKKEQLIK